MKSNNYYTQSKTDFGPEPFTVNIEYATIQNPFYRRALWTGSNLQLTLMCIPPYGEIGLEMHPQTDQFLRLEEGQGIVKMGNSRERLDFQKTVYRNEAVIVPAGTWHNIINTGFMPLKLYTIYAPPHHPHGTIHRTKAEADAMGD
ncbi:cupin domain-containing protein [Sedimentibacter sp.]|uniref:cupin domain-containing protein n=1 Tax=Sedimentibacter sp. TaxID=1960295 RepID=UPI0028A1C086|nr:cupin domain-containing protein [Sedimentibacter sp.]